MNADYRSGLKIGLYGLGIAAGLFVLLLGGQRLYKTWSDRQGEIQRFAQLEAQANGGEYDACLTTASQISPDSSFYPQAQALGEQCILGLGYDLADQGETRSAISMLLRLPPTSSQYSAAQEQIETLSLTILDQAKVLIQKGELDQAILKLSEIPFDAPAAATAQKLRETWRQDWQKSEKLITEAKAALEQGEWLTAQKLLEQVPANPYWQNQIEPLQEEAKNGIEQVILYEQQQREAARRQAEREDALQTFNRDLEALYNTYIQEGVEPADAWYLACETMDGTVLNQGPEDLCIPKL